MTLSQEVEAGTSGPAVPSFPTLPAPPPRPASAPKPAALAADFFAQQVPSQPVPQKRHKGGAGRVAGRLLRLVVVAGVLGVVGLFGYRYFAGQYDVPTFAEPAPHYSSVSLTIASQGGNGEGGFTVRSDGSADVIDMELAPGTGDGSVVEVITDGQTAFVQGSGGAWAYGAYDDSEGAFESLAAITRVYTWNIVVPRALNDYVEVVSKETVTLNGLDLTKYELSIRARDFERDHPAAFDEWSSAIAMDAPPEQGRLLLWVDEHGVIWQMSSYGDDDPSAVTTVTMNSYSTDPFVPNYPTEYTDTLNSPEAVAPAG